MSHQAACPHCGKLMRDLWDHDWGCADEIETNCGHCGKPVLICRDVSVSYTAFTPRTEARK